MNLLSFLLKTFLTKEAITILAKKTGISKDLIRKHQKIYLCCFAEPFLFLHPQTSLFNPCSAYEKSECSDFSYYPNF